jgi:phage protein D
LTSPSQWKPFVRITTPDVFLPFVISDLVVHKEEKQHQWAQITVRYYIAPNSNPLLGELPAELWWEENKPVRIVYGGTPALPAEFVGYVVSPELISTGSTDPHIAGQMINIRYTLLGATKPLQTLRDKVWTSCTASYMAREIAAANGLAAVVGTHPRVFDSRHQHESDFSFLRRIAAEIGWRLSVDGSTLYLTDPRTALTSATPVFRKHSVGGLQDTMQSFTAVAGDLDPSGAIRAEHETVSLSSAGVVMPATSTADRTTSTGQSVGAQVRRRTTGYVAGSYAEAQAVSAAAVSRNILWAQAAATVDGDTGLAPGCVVSLGGKALPNPYTGQWMTRSAHHRISISLKDPRMSSYYVDLTLGRDQADRLTVLSAPAVPAAASVLTAGRWTSRRTV